MARKFLPVLSVLATLVPFAASADPTIRTGSLVCNIAGGVGLIVMSQKAVTCRYDRIDGRQEFYTGTASKFGMDIGVTTASGMLWGVFEPAAYNGGLGGQYTGATGQITVGAGVGANVLVGGGNGGVALQPLSVQVQGGLNLAAGVGALTLAQITPPPPVVVYRHHYRHGHKHWRRHYRHHHRG